MDDKKPNSIDYYIYEGAMARAERQVQRWIVAFIIAFVALVGTNIGWIIYDIQYEDVVTTVTQESSSEGGGDSIINGNNAGGVFYGESETDGNN